MKKLITFILATVMVCALAGCSSGGVATGSLSGSGGTGIPTFPNSNTTIPTIPQNGGYNSVVGNYRAVRAEYQGQVITGPQLPTIICNLQADGSGAFGNDSDLRLITWSQSGNTITLTLADGSNETTTVTVEGNTLVHLEGGVKIVLAKSF